MTSFPRATYAVATGLMLIVGHVSAADLPVDKTLNDDGFVSIFDGHSLTGWHVSAKSGHSATTGNKSAGRWLVEDGAIVGSQDVPGNGGIILSDGNYADFEVIVEMRNDYGPDSGLFLRSNEKGQAYQYMVDYHDAGNLAGVYGEGLSGGIHHRNYDLGATPLDFTPKPDAHTPCPITKEQWAQLWKHGEWNQLRARIVGNPPTITTWINGVRFTEFTDTEPRHPGAGMIALQVHGGGDYTKQFVRYRGVKVKVLNTEPQPGKQTPQAFQSRYAPTESTRYQLYLPPTYGQTDEKWPLLLFLHGAGESGTDLNLVKVHGPPKLVEQKPELFPFIVVSPQADTTGPIIERWRAKLLAELVDHVAATHAVDTDRLYVTGLSMGGFGTLRLLSHYPNKFAAGLAICGGAWPFTAEHLAPVPLWLVHGDQDLVVRAELSLDLVRAMRAAKSQPRLTILENVDHDSWTQTYADKAYYDWLLSHRLSNRK
jgi:predicted esterase